MGDHVDSRAKKNKPREHDALARRQKASFKQYLRDIEDELLEDDLAFEDQVTEQTEPE